MRPLATPSLELKGEFWAAGKYLERQEADWYVWRRLIGQRRTDLREEMMQTRLGISGVVLVFTDTQEAEVLKFRRK